MAKSNIMLRKFNKGDRVWYAKENRIAVVLDRYKTKSGTRYYVEINGELYDLPEELVAEPSDTSEFDALIKKAFDFEF